MGVKNAQILEDLGINKEYKFLYKSTIKKVKVNKDLKSWEIIIEGPFKIDKEIIEELEKEILTYFLFY